MEFEVELKIDMWAGGHDDTQDRRWDGIHLTIIYSIQQAKHCALVQESNEQRDTLPTMGYPQPETMEVKMNGIVGDSQHVHESMGTED